MVMTSHEIDYTIYGDDLQAVEVELDPQETVIAEAGAMNWPFLMFTVLPVWAAATRRSVWRHRKAGI